MFACIGVHLACHVVIERGHDVVAALQQRDVESALYQVFGCLDADEASTYDDGACSSLLCELVGALLHGEGVFDGTKREDASVFYAGKIGLDGFRAGGEDEAVVGFFVF